MVFNKNNKLKGIKDKNNVLVENILNDNYSDDIDLSMFDDIDINSLRKEMYDIQDAIDNKSIELSPEECIKLQNDLVLISEILDYKSNSKISKSSDKKLSGDNSSHENIIEKNINENFESVDDALNNLINEDSNKSNKILNSKFGVDKKNEFEKKNYFSNLSDDSSKSISSKKPLSYLNSDDENNDKKKLDDDFEIEEDISVNDALSSLIDDYSDEIAIKVQNVSMDFRVSMDKIDTLKEFFIRTIKRNKAETNTVHALKNISFEITKGDRVGIIGFNGAGKSTLLKVLAGIYYPTEGTIETKGKIAPLLELGAGFDNNYTGKDNIFLNGAFLGYPEEFLKEKYDEILEFSELGEAINYHVKTYSSGMRAKLGFSIATIVEPDILIIDEILSVGDIKFRRKSADKIKSLINSGITVLLVSHSVNQIRDLCNKAIWIDEGELKMKGNVNEVCDEYVKAASNASSEQLENIQMN